MIYKTLLDLSPSTLVKKYGEEIARHARGPIADVGCGYGRNAAYLSSFGAHVICVDVDDKALDFVSVLSSSCRGLLQR